MEPRKVVTNVTNAKANAMENDSTWGIRRVVDGIQRIIIEATGNTTDFGSLFLYHTWVIFVMSVTYQEIQETRLQLPRKY